MELEEVAAMLFYHIRHRKKAKKRRFWIHPMFLQRPKKGAFSLLYNDLRKHKEKFFNYYRIRQQIQGQNTNFRNSISPEEKLTVTLRYLATGCSFGDFSHNFRLGMTTVRTIVREVCVAIFATLKPVYLRQPTGDEWKDIAKTFNERSQFPNCVGAVDGKHIRINQPPRSGSLYYNYKKYLSIVLLAICDADYKFIYVDIGAYGRSSDSTIFNDSTFYHKLSNKTLQLPEKSPITSTDPTPIPHIFVADAAFPLTNNIMKPYSGSNLNVEKKIFNYRLSRARRYIECTFGILANKWRILHRPLDVDVEFAIDIVKSCCVLHNFVRTKDGVRFEDMLTYFPTYVATPIVHNRNKGKKGPSEYRDKLARFFVNEGQLEWQNKYI